MDSIQKEFRDRAIVKAGTYLFGPQDAIEVVKKCSQIERKILGIDAFVVTDNTVQPFMEHSIDYSVGGLQGGNWNEAEQFILERAEMGFVFEVVYE